MIQYENDFTTVRLRTGIMEKNCSIKYLMFLLMLMFGGIHTVCAQEDIYGGEVKLTEAEENHKTK